MILSTSQTSSVKYQLIGFRTDTHYASSICPERIAVLKAKAEAGEFRHKGWIEVDNLYYIKCHTQYAY